MGAIATIKTSSLLSATGTTTSATVGVDRSFDPAGQIAPGVQQYVDRSAGIPVGYPYITFSMRKPTKDSRMYRVTAKVGFPTLETVGTAPYIPGPKIAYTCLGSLECWLPERSTTAERTLLFNTLKSLFETTIQASDFSPTDLTSSPLFVAVANLENVYS